MEQVELYDGVVFNIPDPPAKTKILNHILIPKNQKWKRVPLPDNFNYWSKEEQERYAFEEDRKCDEGIFFYNNGKVRYITGDHYFYLQWFKIDGGYPDYRDRDRRWFYHWKVCDDDQDCVGQCYGKLRRDGYSYRIDAIILNRARKTFDSNYGMVSKTGDDSKELFRKLVSAFGELPSFFKPQVSYAEKVQKELVFDTPQKRITHKNRIIEKELALKTRIDYKAPSSNAYDSTKQKVLGADESGKWEETDFERWYHVAKTCVTQGRRIIGKLLVGSTVNESKKGGKQFKAVWDQSNAAAKNDNGRTISGLYRYFVTAADGFEGFIDEYGESVIYDPLEPVMGIDGQWITVGAYTYLMNERKAKEAAGDLVGFYEEIRQRPLTVEEMFRDPANEQTQFDLDKIYQQIEHNATVSSNPLRRGNFIWKDGIQDSEVVFEDDNNGKWLVAWMPPQDERNRFIVKRGKKSPAFTHSGLFGVDPYDHRFTTTNKQSKAASHGLHKLSFNEPFISNTPVTQYWGRPKDPYNFYEDMIIQSYVYGWEILGESNKPGCINYFVNRGYEGYLMDRPAFSHNEHSKENQKEKWIPNTGTIDKGIRRMLVDHTISYVYQNIGINSTTGMMGNFKFTDTLYDLANFDIEAWTDYDLSVSLMIAVLGLNVYMPLKKKRDPIKLFDIYNTAGMSSVLINKPKPQ